MNLEVHKKSGISPIIGVILLVSLTVALVTLATVIIFNIGVNDISNSSDTAVQIQNSSNGLSVEVIRNENLEQMRVEKPDGSSEILDASVGINDIDADESGTYKIIGISEDGSENLILTENISIDNTNEEGSETVSGSVSTNPDIVGAVVKSFDSNDNKIDTAITDENGEYEIDIIENSEVIVNIKGSTDVNGNPFYAGASKEVTEENEKLNFTFNEISETTVDDELITVSYNIEETNSINQISNVKQLQAINNTLNEDYELILNIDASETESWNEEEDMKGFQPIGDGNNPYEGNFDGNNHTISNLFMKHNYDRDEDTNIYYGMFGTSTESITNLKLDDAFVYENVTYEGDTIVDGDNTAILVGQNAGTVDNIHITGEVEGLVGVAGISTRNIGTVDNSTVDIEITGEALFAGLVSINRGNIINSASHGTYTQIDNPTQTSADSSGAGAVAASDWFIGGVYSTAELNINEDYEDDAGGFIANDFSNEEEIEDSVVGSYWDVQASNFEDSDEGIGLTTSEMQGENAKDNMSQFDFDTRWTTVENDYPVLQWRK